MPAKVALYTLGCKLNFSETSTIGNQFKSKGFEIVDFKDRADVYVFNTCTVTENAEKECRQMIRRALRQNPNAYIVVTGCYAQMRPEEISKIDGVDLILGNNEKFKLFSLINNFQKNDFACAYVSSTQDLNQFGPAHSTDADTRTRAYFKIQDGCDYKCSFCTIPLARGLSRSMDPESAIIEFKDLIKKGYKEVILTGVNVGDYGKAYNLDLFNLLKQMLKVKGEFRIRISSIEPNLLSDEIINLTADEEKLCDHFHIPLQSGSEKLLKLMQRRYKAYDYEKLIEKIKSKIPSAGIGVDVIVGFPGESTAEFDATYKFLSNLPVSYLHVFTYSERPNTKAISLPGMVDVYERRKRNNILRILSNKKKNAFYSEMIGKELIVLFESENLGGIIKGFSSNYVRVSNSFNEEFINKFVKVKILSGKNEDCTGEVKGIKKSIDLIAC